MPSRKPLLASELSRQPKRRGEWAEMKFMAEAASHGLIILKPYGDSARFDFAVTSGGPLHRVQVKSVATCHGSTYRCGYKTGHSYQRYSPAEIDFLVAYVVPSDAWYIIPAAVIGNRATVWVFPHKPNSRGRYEKYREAWHLLTSEGCGRPE